MGLAGARNSAVTGLQAQSTNISISADNISNSSTPGYKAVKGSFSTLVTNSGGTNSYSSGGVSISPQTLIEQQGLIESTSRATDLAISGAGFFAVQDDSGTLLLTRAGSFSVNNKGELTNSAGFRLMAWPLDNDGKRPGETGNTNTTAAESVDSLEVVDTNAASGTASATTTVKVGMNLNAGQATFQGATVVLSPQSSANNAISQNSIIVPASGTQEGDVITFTSNTNSTSFTYGGFAKSQDLGVQSLFGAATSAAAFATGSTLADDDKFTITTNSSGTVTFTYKTSSPNTNTGEFNSLNTLATAINAVSGLTARVSGTVLYVSSDDANEAITFDDVSDSNLHNELGFSNEAAAITGVNRYSTFAGLATMVNETVDLGAVVNNPASAATIDIYAKDPTLTLTVTKNHGAALSATQGALTIDLQSDENGTNTPTQLIVPVEGSDMVPEIGDGTPIGASVSTISFSDGTNTGTFSYGGIGKTKQIGTASSIFGATTALGGSVADTTDRFIDGTGGLNDGETITFSDGTLTQVVTFNDVATSSLAAGEFNSLITLATALESSSRFMAKVANGRLYVASNANANRPVSITASTITGGNDGAVLAAQFGGDFVSDAADGCTIVTTQDTGGGGNNRFASLSQLDTLIEAITNFATIDPSGANASIGISTTSGVSITVGGASNTDLLYELGISSGNLGDGFFTEMGIDGTDTGTNGNVAAADTTATVAIKYDPGNKLKNMAGGVLTDVPHFSRNVRVYDSLGTGHDFRLSFLKTGTNEWSVEFYALDPSEITNDTNNDGLLVSGTVAFNGDGTPSSIATALTNELTVTWTTGSTPTALTFDLGTAGEPAGTVGATVIGLSDGLRQFDSAYNVDFVEQNGVAAGQFNGIEVAEDGTISAKFSNGQIKPIYQLPILTVANPNALSSKTGNVFAVTQASGDVNLKEAGQGGAGVVVPGALEGSTADIAEELTRTIGIQSNYNANAALISTVKAMEEELNRRI